MLKSFSVGECFSVGWARFKQHAWFLMGTILGCYALMFLFVHLLNNIYDNIEPTRSFIDLLSNVVFYWLYFGITVVMLKIIDDKPYTVSDLFVFDKQVIFYLVGALLYGLMVGIGLFLLIVPGVYLALRYGFFWYAVVDGKKGIMESFQESAHITDGVKWSLLLFVFASLGVLLLGLLCFGIGMIVAVPVVMLATTHLYRVLLRQSVVVGETENNTPHIPSQPVSSNEASATETKPESATSSNSVVDSTTDSANETKQAV